MAGPVQGLDSRFWLSHRIVRVNSFFLNQNDVVLVKKKKTKVNGLQSGQSGCRVNPYGQPGHTGFFIPLFFFNPAQFQPRINPLGRPGFQNYNQKAHSKIQLIVFILTLIADSNLYHPYFKIVSSIISY